MQQIIHNIAIGAPAFLFAIVFHEWAHARVALFFGDQTAKMEGRLSLNPAVHADPIGTILFPLIGAITGGVMFGWARPVPIDPRQFRSVKHGVFWVSFAGPGANILLAIVSAFLYVLVLSKIPRSFAFYDVMFKMLRASLSINLVLAVFNLIPFPPLDGSKMVTSFLDYNQARKYEELGRYSFVFIIILWMTNLFQYLMLPASIMAQYLMGFFMWILN